jgi:uncharacterized OB-fold protein
MSTRRPLPIEEPGKYVKPRPTPDATSVAYFQACARGELLIQQCRACSHLQHYPRPLCVRCGGTPDWKQASGRGRVHTFTIIRQMGVAPFSAEVPYVVAMIELEEGPRLMGNISGIEAEQVRIGMPVTAYIVKVTDDIGVPQWRPAGNQ